MKPLFRHQQKLLLLALAICALPFMIDAQTVLNQNATSNGATVVSGGNYTGYVSAGQMATFIQLNGPSAATQGIILNELELNFNVILEQTVNISCFGGSDGIIDVSVIGGAPPYLFEWSNIVGIDSILMGTTEDLLDVPAGIYNLKVIDSNGVERNGFSVTLTEPDPLVAAAGGTNVLCFGGADGSAFVEVTGGTAPYEILWDTGETTDTIRNLAVGTYTATVTDAHGCISTASYAVTQPSAVRVNAEATPVSCFGDLDGLIDLSRANGGTGPYMYQLGSNGYQTDAIYTDLAPGIYPVSVIDANGCEATETVEITEPPLLELSDVILGNACAGSATGSIDITPIGGTGKYSFSWLWPDGSTSVKEDISGATAGSYELTMTDANGCIYFESFEVEEESAADIFGTVDDVLCFRGSTGAIDVTVTGNSPFTYSWNGQGVKGDTSEDLSGLSEGTYTLTVTSTGGCETSMSFDVGAPASALSFTASATEISGCGETAEVIIAAEGGTAPYEYSLDGVVYIPDDTIAGLSAGDYEVFVRDANGCELSEIVSVVDNGSDAFEPNESIRKSPPVISLDNLVTARIAPARDVDVFAFNSDTAGLYTLSLIHTESFEFNIYADTKTMLTPVSSDAESKTYQLDAGTEYFIEVSGGAAKLWSYDCYTLIIEGEQAAAVAALNKSANLSNSFDQISQLTEFGVRAYPNPTSGRLMLEIKSPPDETIDVLVTNITGQEIIRNEYRDSPFIELDLSGNNAGMYYIRTEIKDQVFTNKIVLQHR
ncbi:T9SS type A sorting domain-containing protein [Maribellus mangrovi]|uniref:T9SS type A sorting domain-containing protein n=1 Tax=Maribellus mangrovi TaxID=3133146 RepID=UPI0030EC3148